VSAERILVIDNAIPDPAAYRAAALDLLFSDVPAGRDVFKGIARVPVEGLRELEAHFPGPAVASFFRKSPLGQLEPNFIHSDEGMGDWTAILYLNPDPPEGDGTSFWRRSANGAKAGSVMGDEGKDLRQWERWRHVEAQFGRLVVFPALLFHSRGLVDNYGYGDEARLVHVTFGRYA
jgi:hypothetical protein